MTLATLVAFALAQDCVPAVPPSVEAYPPNTLIKGVGFTDLEVTSESPACKRLVQQGFALRHCFWFNESLRSFRDATKADPNCAIAHLGVAMIIENSWYRLRNADEFARESTKKAVQLSDKASPLERALIVAYRSAEGNVGKMTEQYERVVKEFPTSLEAKMLLAGHLVQTDLGKLDANGNPIGEMVRARELCDRALAARPDLASAHHYLIHAWEGSSTPEKALDSATRLGQLAPTSGHMVHMPGHIYFRVGNYERAEEVFAASCAVDENYAKDLKLQSSADWNYGHNVAFRIANLAESGRFELARSLFQKSGNPDQEMDLRWRRNDWSGFDLKKLEDDYNGHLLVFAALAQGQTATAQKAADLLDKEAKNVPGTGNWGAMTKGLAAEARGRLQSAVGKHEQAITNLKQACYWYSKIAYDEPPAYVAPPHEALGYALIKAKRFDEARTAFLDGMKQRPKSGFCLLGLARAKVAEGKDATAEYQAFLAAWPKADANSTEVLEAKTYLAK